MGVILSMIITLMICGVIFIYERVSGNIVLGEIAEANAGKKKQSNTAEGFWGEYKDEEDKPSEYGDYCIILDAGHGGSDGGTLAEDVLSQNGRRIDVLEKDINLSVVFYMEELLEELGVEVILTRESDETLSLDERVKIANSVEADLFVSIHCNYYEDDASISGLESYFFEGSDSGKSCAEKILEKVESGGKIETRNAKESNFYVLKKTNIPAVLVELGYLSNTKECLLLAEKEYQETMAKELVAGILEVLE